MSPELSHLDAHGHAFMVDVTAKVPTARRAVAKGVVAHAQNTVALLRAASAVVATGAASDVAERAPGLLEGARLAGLGAAKRTSELIPLCHPLPLTSLEVGFELSLDAIEVYALAETFAQTGVEMEALTACALAAVSLLGAAREHDPLVSIEQLTVWEKRGGRSGVFQRAASGEIEDAPPSG